MIGGRFWSPVCGRLGCEVDREDESDVDGRGGTFTWEATVGLRLESDVLRAWVLEGTGERAGTPADSCDAPFTGVRVPDGRGSDGSPH